MTLRYIFHYETHLGKQFFWFSPNFLTVLKRAGRMIGRHDALMLATRREREHGKILADVLGEMRHPRGLLGVGLVGPQHEAIVLDRRPAAGGRDEDGIELFLLHL